MTGKLMREEEESRKVMSETELIRLDRETRRCALRFAADRLCAWSLCGDGACLRARACRGDVRRCARLLGDWFAAFEAERRARPSFEAIEAGLATPAEVKVYRAWRRALEAASKEHSEDDAEMAHIRQELKRRIEALARQRREFGDPGMGG
ncbi:DNA-binding protein [Methyloceanibacter sp.]|uniref:DNA-binding protein n=1 Tax=Methyloceanibacter sp. TaxID=1965321 RepID=UPI002D2EDEDA|nr:hypothetical protein [Methyloceanibacter sp.]HZP10677.1 hypothetical protein [Methyloceanibacter sp.]